MNGVINLELTFKGFAPPLLPGQMKWTRTLQSDITWDWTNSRWTLSTLRPPVDITLHTDFGLVIIHHLSRDELENALVWCLTLSNVRLISMSSLCIQSRDTSFSLDGAGLQEITISHYLGIFNQGAAHKICYGKNVGNTNSLYSF